MVPAAITPKVVHEIADLLDPNDTIIDGGNSYYKDDIDMAVTLQPQGIHYIDCGTSGGVWGLERGYCLMIGGEDEACSGWHPSSRRWRPVWMPHLARRA